MKRLLFTYVCVVLFLIPTISSAASVEETYRATLLSLIRVLTEQVTLLQSQLEAQRVAQQQGMVLGAVRPPVLREDELIQSQFYDGDYIALYATDGPTLIPIGLTHTRSSHTQLWKLFVSLVGQDFIRSHMQEFRVYSSKNTEYDAFTEQDARWGSWILGVNVYELDLTQQNSLEEIKQLFVHEVGHIIVDENPDMYKKFVSTFWNTEEMKYADIVESLSYGDLRNDIVLDYYGSHTRNFVTEYAATSPLEDIVESFVAFVYGTPYTGKDEKDDKVNFFSVYQNIKEIRAQISKSL